MSSTRRIMFAAAALVTAASSVALATSASAAPEPNAPVTQPSTGDAPEIWWPDNGGQGTGKTSAERPDNFTASGAHADNFTASGR